MPPLPGRKTVELFGRHNKRAMNMRLIRIISCILVPAGLVLALVLPCTLEGSQRLEPMIGVIDIRTTYSDGDFSARQLVAMAKERGIDALLITDHDRMLLQYGLFPFRNLLFLRIEKPSVLKNGAREYFAMLDKASGSGDVIIVPGLESAPFYYWTGWPIPGRLTAHDWEKHLLIFGMEDAESINGLPILHNTLGTRYVQRYLPWTIPFAIPLLFCLWLVFIKGTRRWWSWSLLIVSTLLLIAHHPFASSPFDPYHGDQGIQPYQELIDYVNSRGGMCFWSHPETTTGVRDLGTIKVSTPPHPDDLLEAQDYTGLAAVYGDIITATEPGMQWDVVLNEFCTGLRKRPAWGISSSDYHNEHPAPFGTYITTFLVTERTKQGVLEAMGMGRMYNYIGPQDERITLERFEVEDPGTGNSASMGEEMISMEPPVVRVRAMIPAAENPTPLRVRIIRSGKVCYRGEEHNGVVDVSLVDLEAEPGGMHFYRVEIKGKGRMLSNPIFVTLRKGP
ncbi:MAG: hypothetical protein ACMUIL_12470 [bacterium]